MTTAPTNLDAVQGALRGERPIRPASWDRVRDDLSRRASDEGLIDVAFERHDSPLGTLVLGATVAGLVRIALPAEDEDAVLDDLARRISPRVMRSPSDSVTRARQQLDEYFGGKRRAFDLPLDWRLTTGFRREVLQETAGIAYGQTLSYRQVATRAGRPAAVRAAGGALGSNPLPIVVPCHRVLRSDGKLGGYRGGVEMKVRLLELERTTD